MTFEDLDFDDDVDFDEGFGDEEQGGSSAGLPNRTFMILAGVIGGVIILAIICIVIFLAVINPQKNEEQAALSTAAAAQQAEVALIVGQTATSAALTSTANSFTATPTETLTPTITPTATNTPEPPTPVVAGTSMASETAAFNATMSALQAEAQTLEAKLTFTSTPTAVGAADALPEGGFAEGLLALGGVAVLLIVVMFAAHRLRTRR